VRPGNPRRFNEGFHGYLVGGDWNHGILNDLPQKLGISWNFIIPTDELTPSFFRGVGFSHQPGI